MLVCCNGMIRSGSTLQFNVARELVERCGVGSSAGFVSAKAWKTTEVAGLWDRARTSDAGCWVVKAHEPPPDAEVWARSGGLRILYTFRDLRDVAASLLLKGNARDEEDAGRQVAHAIAVHGRIAALPGVLMQQYEELITDLTRGAEEVARHLELAPTRSVMTSVVQSLQSMGARRPNQPVQASSGSYDPVTLLHENHVSRFGGRPGTWREVLSRQFGEHLTAIHHDWLVGHGYDAT